MKRSCDQKQLPFRPPSLLLLAVCRPCWLLAVGVLKLILGWIIKVIKKLLVSFWGDYLDGLGLFLFGLLVLPLVGKEKLEKIS